MIAKSGTKKWHNLRKMQNADHRKEIDWSLLWFIGLENAVIVPISIAIYK